MCLFQGLQQHMRASHDLFDYGFSEDSPTRLPAVSVELANNLYNASHTFQSLEAASLGDSVSKVLEITLIRRCWLLRQMSGTLTRRRLDNVTPLVLSLVNSPRVIQQPADCLLRILGVARIIACHRR